MHELLDLAGHANLLVPDVPRWSPALAAPVISLAGVSIAFRDHVVLDDLSLDIPAGQTTVIVGRSGSGKSVLLKLMMGLVRPDRGRVTAFGRDLATVSEVELLELRKRMGMVFQNYALFDALSVADNIGFGLHENAHLRDREIAELSRDLIATLGLAGSEHLLPGELSGGMRKRVGLARALVSNPEVVLFDEPTTGLDPIMVETVDELIATTRARYRITSVIVSHDLASIRRLADRAAFLHEGRIIFTGSYDQLIESDLAPIRAFVDSADPGARPPVFASGSGSMPVAAPISDAPVVELVGVHKHFGANHVLRGIDLAIPPRQTTVLIGGSGSGKSVLIKLVMGLLAPDAGEVRVFGTDIVPMTVHALNAVRRHFGMVFQHAALLDWMSVGDNLAFPLTERGWRSPGEIRDRVDFVLDRLGVAALRARMPGEISMAERKRVAIARALVTEPDIVIYDEPTTGQDPLRTREIDDMIRRTQDQFPITSIVISHDMASTFRIADRIALLHAGTIAACGTPDELRAATDGHVRNFIRAGSIAAG